MSRLLLLGFTPPACLGGAKIEAAHYRTAQFVEPLLEDGHVLCLCSGRRGERPVDPAGLRDDRLEHHPIAFGAPGWRRRVQAHHDAFRPDAVIAIGFQHALYATALRTSRPRWMDVYGDQLTIMQAAASRLGRDRGVGTIIAQLGRVLRIGDAFSGCGTPQVHALVGELAMCGRLNRHTFGYAFAHAVWPGAPRPRAAEPPSERRILRAAGIAPGDFVVLWCGGYNTWTDVATLFDGLELAMARVPRLHLVSVGGSTYRAPETAYDRLQALIAASSHRTRYHLLGWRPWHEIASYYAESDVGINVDGQHYETTYGTRTRLMEMLGAALPIVTSRGTELSAHLEAAGAAAVFDGGDAQGFADRLVALAGDPGRRRALAGAARAQAAGPLSFRATTEALRAWAAAPRHAPDRLPENRPRVDEWLEYRARTLGRMALWRLFGRD